MADEDLETNAESEGPRAYRGARARVTGEMPPEADAKRRRRWRRKLIRRWFLYYLLIGPLMRLIELCPRFVLRSLLRGVVQPIAYRSTRGKSERHLKKVYGDQLTEQERKRTAKRVTHHFIRGLEENLTALKNGTDELLERIDDEGAKALCADLVQQTERGFIGLTGHCGNWELLGSWFAKATERPLAGVIAKRNTNPYLNARIERFRKKLGMHTFYREDPPNDIIRALRRGEHVAIVPDQDVKSIGGLFVDFFDSPAYTPTGPARLALTANVPIAVGVLVRTDDGRFTIDFAETIWPDRKAPRDEEIARLTQAWNSSLERLIDKHRDQWAWFHERWKTTPEKLEERGRVRTGGAKPVEQTGKGTEDNA